MQVWHYHKCNVIHAQLVKDGLYCQFYIRSNSKSHLRQERGYQWNGRWRGRLINRVSYQHVTHLQKEVYSNCQTGLSIYILDCMMRLIEYQLVIPSSHPSYIPNGYLPIYYKLRYHAISTMITMQSVLICIT